MTEPTHAFETMTARQAEAALQKNEVNRHMRKTKVEQYSRDMKAGKWNPYTAPIIFDENGRLIDGQHRLTAQVKANVKLKWLVIRHVPANTQDNIDVGIGRSLADILHFEGESSAQLLAAISRLVHTVLTGLVGRGRYAISNEEVVQTLKDHPEIRTSVEVARWFHPKKMVPLPPSVMGTAHWMISRVNGEEEATAFIRRISTLANEREGSPVLALSRRVNEIRRQQMRVNSRDLLNLVIKTWNYDAENKTVNKITLYSKTGEFQLAEVKKRKVPLAEDGGDEESSTSGDEDE